MFTVVGYDAARAGAVALAALAAVPDAHVRAVGNDIIVPDLANLAGVYMAHGTAAVAGVFNFGQIQAPSLRELVLKDVNKGHNINTPLAPDDIDMFPDSPIALKKDELIEAWMDNGACAASRGLAALFLSDGPLAPVKGKIQTIRCLTVLVAAADAWTLGVLAPVQALPAGEYQIVGMSAVSLATAGICRLVFVGGVWRPGCPIRSTTMVPDPIQFRYGNMGVWGTFKHNTPPNVEVLEVAAVNNPDVYLDVIKVA